MYHSVAILGAGAVGCYLLWGLSTKPEIDTFVVASGERKERFERDGFLINDRLYHPVVKTPEEAHGADLLIVTVKYNSLPQVLPDIQTIVDDHTTVISFMNGVDSEEIIAGAIGESHLLYAVIKVASERKGNAVRFDGPTSIGLIYGEKDGSMSPRVQALDELLADTGLNYRASAKIINEMWSKFRLNVPNNQVQAMIGCGVGAYRDSAHVRFLQHAVLAEVDAIARAKGIDFNQSDKSSSFGSKVMDQARYSTLQDLDAGRHTEVDMFSGAIIRMGRELGIPTPYNEFVYHMIKALEEKNDGMFDYEGRTERNLPGRDLSACTEKDTFYEASRRRL